MHYGVKRLTERLGNRSFLNLLSDKNVIDVQHFLLCVLSNWGMGTITSSRKRLTKDSSKTPPFVYGISTFGFTEKEDCDFSGSFGHWTAVMGPGKIKSIFQPVLQVFKLQNIEVVAPALYLYRYCMWKHDIINCMWNQEYDSILKFWNAFNLGMKHLNRNVVLWSGLA